MKAQEISEWVEERNKALEKHNPELVYKLLKKYEGMFYNVGDAEFFKSLSEKEQILTMCHMIVLVPGLSNQARAWAAQMKARYMRI